MTKDALPTLIDYSDLEVKEIPVKVKNESFILREATGEAARQYRNAMMACTTLSNGKATKIQGIADCESLLVSLCLLQENENGGEKYVERKKILAWPDRVQKELYNTVKRMSNMVEEEETAESLTKEKEKIEEKLKKLEEEDNALGKSSTATTDGLS